MTNEEKDELRFYELCVASILGSVSADDAHIRASAAVDFRREFVDGRGAAAAARLKALGLVPAGEVRG